MLVIRENLTNVLKKSAIKTFLKWFIGKKKYIYIYISILTTFSIFHKSTIKLS